MSHTSQKGKLMYLGDRFLVSSPSLNNVIVHHIGKYNTLQGKTKYGSVNIKVTIVERERKKQSDREEEKETK